MVDRLVILISFQFSALSLVRSNFSRTPLVCCCLCGHKLTLINASAVVIAPFRVGATFPSSFPVHYKASLPKSLHRKCFQSQEQDSISRLFYSVLLWLSRLPDCFSNRPVTTDWVLIYNHGVLIYNHEHVTGGRFVRAIPQLM